MKKGIIWLVVSIVMALCALVSIATMLTVTGSGFLDLSNIVRYVCLGIALICGTISVAGWLAYKKKREN